MDILKIVHSLTFLVVSLHGSVTLLFPLGWANLAFLLDELKGCDESVDLVNVSANAEAVLLGVSQVALGVDDVSGSYASCKEGG